MVTMPSGVLPVLYSFYRPDGGLDLDANARQIDYALASGANGITLLGLASEGGLLTAEERLSSIRAAAVRIPKERNMLITVRPEDDARVFADAAMTRRRDVALIFQVGADAGAALAQCRKLRRQCPEALCGLQLAPGLIAGSSATAELLVGRADTGIDFIKAEYNSLELAGDMTKLDPRPVLLVGKHGFNLIEYLRIGAAGVIPGTEMTAALSRVLDHYRAGRTSDALAHYGRCASYVDFAMQDLDTVITVGREVTARALGFSDQGRRATASRHTASLNAAIDVWAGYWTDVLSSPAS